MSAVDAVLSVGSVPVYVKFTLMVLLVFCFNISEDVY